MMHFLLPAAVLCTAVLAAPALQERDHVAGCNHDNCLRAFLGIGASATPFCANYLPSMTLPGWAKPCTAIPSQILSACSCISVSVSQIATTTSSTAVPTTSATSPTITLASTTSTTSSTAISTSSTTPPTTSAPTSSSTGVSCTATEYAQIAPAVAACTTITLQDIYAPPNSPIDLSKLKAGSVVTFAGTTTFGFTNSSSFNPMTFGGVGITITSAPGAIIDGNGQAYWDGQGSNGGLPKPDHFIVVSKVTGGSVIENLHIQNWPTHLWSISNCRDLTFQNLYMDNTAGDAPNAISGGLPAAHNSDGFDLSTSNNTLITDSTVLNQDDCVAITSGNNVTVQNMYCSGGHGLSIGSVGGKSNNNVTNILFQNSKVVNSQNGPRIKSNFNTTGFISNITYSNIIVENISIYGIDVQQDYLNGGPTGNPSNGVIIENLLFNNITGTAGNGAQDYYVLCGEGSCSNIVFTNVDITGGTVMSSCNFPATGCPGP